MTRFSHIVHAVAAVALFCAGCSDDAAELEGQAEGPLWVATGWTQSGEEWSGFLAVADDLTSGAVDLAQVVDLGTDMSIGSDERGNVFVGRDDAPVLERWSLDAKGVLQKTNELGLDSLGITSAMGGNRNVIQVINDTRAYYFDNEGFRVVVFNPTTMTLTDNFSIAPIFDAPYASINFISRVGDRFFVSTRLWAEDDSVIKELRVAIVSATSNEVQYITDTRCGDMAFTAKDAQDNVYFGSHHATAVYETEDPNEAKPCMLRILAGTSQFDPAYHVDLDMLVGGHGAGLFQGPNGTAFIAKYESADPISEDAFNAAVWRLYQVNLGAEAGSLTQVPNLPLTTRYVGTFDTVIDGKVVPFLVTDSETGSSYMSLADPAAPTPGLSVTGGSFGRAILMLE